MLFLQIATWMALLTSIEAIALTLLRIGGLRNSILAAALFAGGVVPLLSKTLEYDGIGMVNFVWNVFSTVLMFAVGIFFFSEKVTRLKSIGILLSFAGLGLIVLADDYQK